MTKPTVVLVGLAAMMLPARMPGQSIVVSATALELPAPDLAAYHAGTSSAGSFSVTVSACDAPQGCRLTIQSQPAAPAADISLQWRLVSVTRMGVTDSRCASAPDVALVWRALEVRPVALMDTGVTADPGSACVARIEVRVSHLTWHEHRYAAPTATFWSDVLLRVHEK